jgi:Family of unknown function (DUF6526)
MRAGDTAPFTRLGSTSLPEVARVHGVNIFSRKCSFVANHGRRLRSLQAFGLIAIAFSAIVLALISRAYTVRLQNRIIRLEMRLRLERLGRADEFTRLTSPQLVGLRFASDAELPDLVDRALREDLALDQIKRKIEDWQPDFHRT